MKLTSTLLMTSFCMLIINMFAGCNSPTRQPSNQYLDNEPRILVVTSGHQRFDTKAFFEMIFAMDSMLIDTISQPYANLALLSDSIHRYNALLFFDMWQAINEEQKDAFINLTHEGIGLVFLHHALVSYQEWDAFKQIIGGKYYHDRFEYPAEMYSTYKHDITLEIEVIDNKHPVTAGLKAFEIIDEGYGNIEMLPEIKPLLSTQHPDCTNIVAWAHQYNNSKVVYILPGHGPEVFAHPQYRQLIFNSLNWSKN